MFYYQNFFLFQICSLLDCSQQMPPKKIGCHRACFLTNCRERWTQFSDRSQDIEFARWRLGRDTKWRPSCSKSALDIKLVFGCFYVFDIANTEIHTWEDAKITKNEVSQDLMRFYSYEPLVETILQRWRFVNIPVS